MENLEEIYTEEVTPSNQIKGFTKSFVKRTKNKRDEDVNVKELLSYVKQGNIILGSKVTQKEMKKNNISKVFVASNCDKITYKKLNHYAKLLDVEVVELDLKNNEISQKLSKPFLITTIGVKK